MITRLSKVNVHIEFILLCETFLNDRNQNLYAIEGYNLETRNRAMNSRGGVAIYIRSDISYKRRNDLELNIDGEFESIFVETLSQKMKTIVGEIYRIPNTNEIESLNRYEIVLNKLPTDNCRVILSTDQNFDLLKIEYQQNTCTLLDNFLTSGLMPMINKPTRVVHTTATLIDNIYMNSNQFQHANRKASVLLTDISDHYPVMVSYAPNIDANLEITLKIKTRKFDEIKLNNINQSLLNTNWDFISEYDVELSFRSFINKLQEIIELHAPEKEITIPAKDIIRTPWITAGLMKSNRNLTNYS